MKHSILFAEWIIQNDYLGFHEEGIKWYDNRGRLVGSTKDLYKIFNHVLTTNTGKREK